MRKCYVEMERMSKIREVKGRMIEGEELVCLED